ncbi:MAG: SagB/ThcOx family dehydrogenase [Candidatus Omnitrophica bacterium]|nr:SagB/ThcOx family dehydrogenase [Candidatus Omnitrophota bacterium]
MKKEFIFATCLIAGTFFAGRGVFAEDLQSIELPAPQITAGKPLMQALSERRSGRSFSSEELSPQVLSDLLWAANGVNRPDGRRTAPSASNRQEIDVYVAKKEGLYLYNAGEHELTPVLAGDIRSKAGEQGFVEDAPLVLIYVADLEKFGGKADAEFYGATDTGFVSQNVYLYCASEGLATVVLGWVDKTALAEALKLRPGQKVILTQPVGYPKK